MCINTHSKLKDTIKLSVGGPNDNDPPYFPKIIHVGVTPADPSLLEMLPPEIRTLIAKDVQIGAKGPEVKKEEKKPEVKPKKVKFDYKMVNCNQNLKELTEKLKTADIKQYGILLYGVSGSGKSHYAQWLAQELKMPFIKKRCSDLIDKFVGESEKRIRAAFDEAKEKKAVLLFDEADSFLFDRKYADREHEVMSVNEFLTQMEDHPYPFIMTTNLKDKIDKASLRRFVFKIKYDYMKPENINAGVKTYFGKDFKLTDTQIKDFHYLCAGDFKVAKQKMDILEHGNYTNELIYKYLLQEQSEKDIQEGSPKINF